MKRARTLERDIQRSGVAWLRGKGCICIKLSTLGRYGTSGWPDYLVLQSFGIAWFAEFKVPGAELTPLQEEHARKLRELGFEVFVIRDSREVQIAWEAMQA